MQTFNEFLGKTVKERRELRGLTQADLAKKAGISRVRIGQIERGEAEPSVGTLNKIAEALDAVLDITITPTENL